MSKHFYFCVKAVVCSDVNMNEISMTRATIWKPWYLESKHTSVWYASTLQVLQKMIFCVIISTTKGMFHTLLINLSSCDLIQQIKVMICFSFPPWHSILFIKFLFATYVYKLKGGRSWFYILLILSHLRANNYSMLRAVMRSPHYCF